MIVLKISANVHIFLHHHLWFKITCHVPQKYQSMKVRKVTFNAGAR